MDRYTRTHEVSAHAVQRFRERFGEWLQKEGMLADDAVANFLDRLVAQTGEEYRTEMLDSTANHQPTTLVEINDPLRFGQNHIAFALVRKAGSRDVIVTVLSPEMVENNRRQGLYLKPGSTEPLGKGGHRPFADKLKAVVPVRPTPSSLVPPLTQPLPRLNQQVGRHVVAIAPNALDEMSAREDALARRCIELEARLAEVTKAAEQVKAAAVAAPQAPAIPLPEAVNVVLAAVKKNAADAFIAGDDKAADSWRGLLKHLDALKNGLV